MSSHAVRLTRRSAEGYVGTVGFEHDCLIKVSRGGELLYALLNRENSMNDDMKLEAMTDKLQEQEATLTRGKQQSCINPVLR